MAEVVFHTGIAEPLGFACRMLRKACRQGARVLVTAPGPTLAALDRALWTFDERDFVPHLRVSAANAASDQAARTPIWLVDGPAPPESPTILVNLGAPVPEDAARFSRVIEIVADTPDEAGAARERWRTWKAHGLLPTHHSAANS
ncbi:DNA polymerase III subunit chi [Rubrivivax gelatinosus]|uniref:DNA polymerase III subunit chi n=1 Tax=Rubrivivax gelatinosus TaxID=28068 RepID=A0ABS1DYB8_RUBGE|nr:DNA polymerase III subunit chi [Rubrivivax gelatinosus]MBK1715087.1 DNA polymerase III subunit chi [Rubrivivax gelatinosus]